MIISIASTLAWSLSKTMQQIDPYNKLCNPILNGSSYGKGSKVGILLRIPDTSFHKQSLRFGFHAWNNEAEYGALFVSLKLAKSLGANKITIENDSQLVVNQVKGIYNAEDPNMAKYQQLINDICSILEYF